MALGRALSAAIVGVTATIVDVEANVGPGLPRIQIVGLADTAISESRDRMKTAVANSQLHWPKTKVVVSLSPASMPKAGSHFDVAMCLAILTASSTDPLVRQRLSETVLLGEVGLDGSLRPVAGVLPVLMAARRAGFAAACGWGTSRADGGTPRRVTARDRPSGERCGGRAYRRPGGPETGHPADVCPGCPQPRTDYGLGE